MPQLDPTWLVSQLFWLFVTIVILFFALSRLALPALMEVLDKRNAKRQDDLSRAQKLKDEAEETLRRYENVLLEGREKAGDIYAKAKATFEAEAEKAHKELDAVVEKQLHEAEASIAAKKQQWQSEIAEQCVELVRETSKTLVGDSPSDDRILTAIHHVGKS